MLEVIGKTTKSSLSNMKHNNSLGIILQKTKFCPESVRKLAHNEAVEYYKMIGICYSSIK